MIAKADTPTPHLVDAVLRSKFSEALPQPAVPRLFEIEAMKMIKPLNIGESDRLAGWVGQRAANR